MSILPKGDTPRPSRFAFVSRGALTSSWAFPNLRGAVAARVPGGDAHVGLGLGSGSIPQAICGGRIRPPKGVYGRIPRSRDRVRVHGKAKVSLPISRLQDGETSPM